MSMFINSYICVCHIYIYTFVFAYFDLFLSAFMIKNNFLRILFYYWDLGYGFAIFTNLIEVNYYAIGTELRSCS